MSEPKITVEGQHWVKPVADPKPHVDLEKVRERHYNSPYKFARGTCAHCCGEWPCLYARLADEVERLDKSLKDCFGDDFELVDLDFRLHKLVDEKFTAHREITRLTEALEFYADEHYDEWPRGSRARAALTGEKSK